MEKWSDEWKTRCETLRDNYLEITDRIAAAARRSGRRPEDITLLAATKTVPVEIVNYGIELGIPVIGENKVQEFLSKETEYLPCTRHFIGHLQTNKVRQIVGKVSMIHSVDRLKLAQEIARVSSDQGITTDILIEVNIGREESKSGIMPEQLSELVEQIDRLQGLCLRGLMAIPPICEKKEQIREYFSRMYQLFIDIGAKKLDNGSIQYLSMGMSGDYEEAVLEGANLVRIGSALFGARNYNK
ncbi:MAG: YggS family pyridoxal phosphate-dependent enzyme [Clostridiales bacterium]|jgi:pyridoxal phosphate enzyme (YggS family)|nr:YggS family pyridoxal phosphate-dependent enzyme [Clostridiales bacterium]